MTEVLGGLQEMFGAASNMVEGWNTGVSAERT